jgi:glycosyltransferase involved in cell wall biosynthesis
LRPRIAVLLPAAADAASGGAERFAAGLLRALDDIGLDAELIRRGCEEATFEAILGDYLAFYDLDLRQFDGVISTKAPSYVARHANHVCYLMHTMRSFYDKFDQAFPDATPDRLEQRRTIQALDSAALAPSRLRGLFAVGQEVADRLQAFNRRTARALRHPTSLDGLYAGRFRHLLLPGRLHRWKRVDLAIAAMRHVGADVELVITGAGEEAEHLRSLAAGEPRIRFTGHVGEAELRQLYADALAVLFLPQREDLGLVTLEAFGSFKPVITCSDAGEPARLVEDGRCGFVCPPDPAAIAARIDLLAADPARAAALGAAGAASIRPITWPHVATTLAAALGFAPAAR